MKPYTIVLYELLDQSQSEERSLVVQLGSGAELSFADRDSWDADTIKEFQSIWRRVKKAAEEEVLQGKVAGLALEAQDGTDIQTLLDRYSLQLCRLIEGSVNWVRL